MKGKDRKGKERKGKEMAPKDGDLLRGTAKTVISVKLSSCWADVERRRKDFI